MSRYLFFPFLLGYSDRGESLKEAPEGISREYINASVAANEKGTFDVQYILTYVPGKLQLEQRNHHHHCHSPSPNLPSNPLIGFFAAAQFIPLSFTYSSLFFARTAPAKTLLCFGPFELDC